jgi:PAS domain S-box-containing protein
MTEHAAALVFADTSGVVRSWNSAAESLFGHRAAEAIGQTLDLVVPPDALAVFVPADDSAPPLTRL